MKNNFFFITGKGGSGKSTISSLLALELSKKNPVLLISMDSAHSLSSIWETDKIPEKSVEPGGSIRIFEPDFDLWIKKTSQKSKRLLKKKYRFLDAFSVGKFIDLLVNSPGIEDQAIWEAAADEIKKHTGSVVIDAPPTGQAIKLIKNAIHTVKWTKEFSDLQNELSRMWTNLQNISHDQLSSGTETKKITQKALKRALIVDNFIKTARFIFVRNSSPLSISEEKLFSENLGKTVSNFISLQNFSSKESNIGEDLLSIENYGSHISGIKLLEDVLEINKTVFKKII
ncbi:MAG: hypothetical protein JXR95_05465 [Deltaproteobacteria bacterium]|nr:hypothetical protein [Deltaproteobacteria bacterium]